MPRLSSCLTSSYITSIFPILIVGLIVFPAIAAGLTTDSFTSAGVANPSAPVDTGTTGTGTTGTGTAGSGTAPNTGNITGTGNVSGVSSSGVTGGSQTNPTACLGTDLLLQHGFTQSELGRLEQAGSLSYPDRVEYKDTDKDGLFDHEERLLKTDPNKADTDNDGFLDIVEIAFGFDPLSPKRARPFPESLADAKLWANQVLQSLRYALSKLSYLPQP